MAFTIFYNIADGSLPKHHVSRIEIPVDPAAALTTVQGAVETMWNLINPLTTGTLQSAGFTVEADVSGFTNAAAAVLSDVQEKAEFAYRTVAGFLKKVNIPCFDETLFESAGAGDTVDTADTDVAAFNLAMVLGIPYGVGQFLDVVNDHGEDIEDFESAVENWGKRRV